MRNERKLLRRLQRLSALSVSTLVLYAVTVMAASGDAGALTEEWNRLLSSFCLETAA